MIKALLIDADGIVLKARDKYFSDRLKEEGYNFPKDKEKEFFKKVYPDIRLGKKKLKHELKKVVKSWGWNKSVNDLLQFWFSYENKLDKKVIKILQEIRKGGVKLYLASDHSKYRENDLWENVGLRNYFDGKYFSCDMHTTKDKPDFYKKVLHKMRLSSNEVVFFDDEEKNVETAKDVGITAYLYKSSKQFEGLILNR